MEQASLGRQHGSPAHHFGKSVPIGAVCGPFRTGDRLVELRYCLPPDVRAGTSPAERDDIAKPPARTNLTIRGQPGGNAMRATTTTTELDQRDDGVAATQRKRERSRRIPSAAAS